MGECGWCPYGRAVAKIVLCHLSAIRGVPGTLSWYHSIPITLVGTVLHLFFLLGESVMVELGMDTANVCATRYAVHKNVITSRLLERASWEHILSSHRWVSRRSHHHRLTPAMTKRPELFDSPANRMYR